MRHKYNKAATPKPGNLIEVSPSNIEIMVVPPFFRDEVKFGGIDIISGEWDQIHKGHVSIHRTDPNNPKCFPIENWDWHQSVESYLKHRSEWEETKVHDYFSSEFSVEHSYKEKDRIDELYNSICENGFKSPYEIEKISRVFFLIYDHHTVMR